MKNLFLVLLLVLCFLPMVFGQEEIVPALRSDLILLRCDNANGKLLPSPSDIDFRPLWSAFRPQEDSIVMVHGFNNTPTSARESFSIMEGNLKSHLGSRNYIGFYWPSNPGIIEFGKAVTIANQSGPYLIHALREISRLYGGASRKIHLVSHSLGARVALSAFRQNGAGSVKWGHYVGMASAVHCNSYLQEFQGANLVPQKNWIQYSKNDWVLKYLYALYYGIIEDRGIESVDGFAQWNSQLLEEKLYYLRDLEERAQERGAESLSPLDQTLLAHVRQSAKDAMGLVGSMLSDARVTNVEVSNVVDGHSYWDNREIAARIAAVIR